MYRRRFLGTAFIFFGSCRLPGPGSPESRVAPIRVGPKGTDLFDQGNGLQVQNRSNKRSHFRLNATQHTQLRICRLGDCEAVIKPNNPLVQLLSGFQWRWLPSRAIPHLCIVTFRHGLKFSGIDSMLRSICNERLKSQPPVLLCVSI